MRTMVEEQRRKRPPYAGNVPWGFERSWELGRFVPNKHEQRINFVVRHMHAQGMTVAKIVRLLEEIGAKSRTGKPVSRVLVAAILAAPTEPKKAPPG
jgi:hypothetical protein